MEIKVNRVAFHAACTTGILLIDDVFECYTLEDAYRGLTSEMSLDEIKRIKVYGQTAIPTGRYRIEKMWWAKHKRWVPHLLNVPGYGGILIHSGVTERDSLGCLLVGEKLFDNALQNSTAARVKLDLKIFAAIDAKEEVWITIENQMQSA